MQGRHITHRAIHFSVRQLLTAVSAVAVACGLVAMYGLPGVVIVVSIVIVSLLAFRSRHWPVKSLLIVVATGLLWCLCVHGVLERFLCPTCHFQIGQLKYEIFTIPILVEEKRVPSMRTAIAEDFNCPCQHEHMATALRYDDWGMIIRYPRERDPFYSVPLESDEESYDKYVRPITKKILEEQPDLAKEFCTRVLEQRDEEYWNYFHDEVLEPEVDQAVRKERSGSD